MITWILLGVGYVAVCCLFRIVGGVGAAGDAIEAWGRATAERRRRAVSPSS